MPIVGFNLTKVMAEKTKPLQPGITVKNDLEVKDISKATIDIGSKSEEVIRLDFEFIAEYQPEIGKIILLGEVLYMDKEKEIKKILDNWKKTKIVEPELFSKIMNTVLMKCNIKALNLSLDVNLPPHLNMPLIVQGQTVKKEEEKKEYIG